MTSLRETQGRQPSELRYAMLDTMRESPLLIAAGFFWTQFSYLILYLSIHTAWIALVAVLDLAIAGLRLQFGRKRRSDDHESSWIDDINIVATTVWIALIAGTAFFLARVPTVDSVVLATILAIGFAGYVTARFAAFPSAALTMIVFLVGGMTAGFLTSPFTELFRIGLIAPTGAVAFGILTLHAHGALMEAVRAKYENRRLSLHDPLTGLPNRLMMRERLAALGLRWDRDAAAIPFAVLCLDLDGFKHVNDRYGHAAGDEVLKGVAKIIAQEMGDEGLVCRIGGDEFVILLPSADEGTVAVVADRLIAAVARPFSLVRGIEAQVGLTVGVALCPQDGTTPDGLLFRADDALYEAKRAGKGRCLFARPGPGAPAARAAA